MDVKDWYNCGAKIGDLVQQAIDSNDFKQLNKAITDTINSTVDAVQDSLVYRSRGSAYDKAKSDANVNDLLDQVIRSFAGSPAGTRNQAAGPARKNYKGLGSIIAGFTTAGVTGLMTLSFLFTGWLTGIGAFKISALFLAVISALFIRMGMKGVQVRGRLKRVENYLRVMDGRDVVSLEELAAGTGQSVKELKKDLKEMIREGLFPSEAYLDTQETTLMTSREAFRQYQETMQAYRMRQQEEAQNQERRRAAEKDLADYSDETRTILEEGRAFIRHIHESNDAIADEVMSEKLDRLEMVVTRIFDQVAAKPESAPDLHRMMSYYLPITQKLVDAYEELGNQQIQGENISKTRKEIEMSLDTINSAFETFLDSFFQDTAWDISSDISTLRTMMARDGLTGKKDFVPGEHIRTVGKDVSPESVPQGTESGYSGVTKPDFSQPLAGSGQGTVSFGGSAAAAAPATEKE